MSVLQITKSLNKQIDATQKEFVQLYDKLKEQSSVERLDAKPLVRLFGAYKIVQVVLRLNILLKN